MCVVFCVCVCVCVWCVHAPPHMHACMHALSPFGKDLVQDNETLGALAVDKASLTRIYAHMVEPHLCRFLSLSILSTQVQVFSCLRQG